MDRFIPWGGGYIDIIWSPVDEKGNWIEYHRDRMQWYEGAPGAVYYAFTIPGYPAGTRIEYVFYVVLAWGRGEYWAKSSVYGVSGGLLDTDGKYNFGYVVGGMFPPIGWAGNLWPPGDQPMRIWENQTADIYCQAWFSGITDKPGQGPGVVAELYWSKVENGNWVDIKTTQMIYNKDIGNNDEYKVTLCPFPKGYYEYTARFSIDGGKTWTWAELPKGNGKIFVYGYPEIIAMWPYENETINWPTYAIHVRAIGSDNVDFYVSQGILSNKRNFGMDWYTDWTGYVKGPATVTAIAWNPKGESVKIERSCFIDALDPVIMNLWPQHGEYIVSKMVYSLPYTIHAMVEDGTANNVDFEVIPARLEYRVGTFGPKRISPPDPAPGDDWFQEWYDPGEGAFFVKATAWNWDGDNTSLMHTAIVDKTPPTVTIIYPDENRWINTDVQSIQYDVTDNVDPAIEGVPDISVSVNPLGPYVTEGEYNVSITAIDGAGWSTSKKIRFFIDKTPPTITVISPTKDLITNQPVTIQYTVIDNLDPKPEVAANYSFGEIITHDGHYILNITAKDSAGNTSTIMVPFTIDSTPPQITINIDRTQLWPPNHKLIGVNMSGSVTDNISGIVQSTFAVSSNEPDEEPGHPHSTDIIADNFLDLNSVGDFTETIYLRAERLGKKSGRVYKITIMALDGAKNSSQAEVKVEVPHDIGKK